MPLKSYSQAWREFKDDFHNSQNGWVHPFWTRKWTWKERWVYLEEYGIGYALGALFVAAMLIAYKHLLEAAPPQELAGVADLASVFPHLLVITAALLFWCGGGVSNRNGHPFVSIIYRSTAFVIGSLMGIKVWFF